MIDLYRTMARIRAFELAAEVASQGGVGVLGAQVDERRGLGVHRRRLDAVHGQLPPREDDPVVHPCRLLAGRPPASRRHLDEPDVIPNVRQQVGQPHGGRG